MKPNHRFLVLALVLCGISAGANAQAFTYEGINYQVTSTSLKEVKVAGNSGYSGEAVIPDSVVYNSDTYAVTEIGNEAFYNCSGLTGALTIPNSVTSIGERAFYGCSGFNGALTIPNSVTSIGSYAFSGCSGLTGTLTIPNSVTSIGYEAFRDCSGLTGIDVATGNLHYSSLDGVLFNEVQDTLIQYPGGKASSYIIPESVKTIGDNAFRNCSGLTGTLTIGNSVTSIGNLAFSGCSGFNGTLTIGNSVISIGNYAFSGCSGLTGALTIPNSVTSIGKQAFFNCSGLTGTLTIGNSVTSIGSSAFYGCRGFNGTLTIGNSVTSIGDQAFYYCRGLTGTLTIPNSVTSIGNNAFYGCRGFNGTLTIGNSVKTIGGLAFSDCSGLTGALTIPDSVTSIGERAFSGCSSFNGALTIPDSVTSIGNYAFSGCSSFNGALTIPNSVKTIGEGAFSGCSSFNGALTIPNSVISIGERAFYGCSGFNGTLTIPNSVTEIGTFAFSGCSGLTSIYVSAAIPPSVGANAFIYVPVGIPVHIPCGSTSAYQGAAEWSRFTNYINRPFNLTVQSEDATKGTASITQANTCNNNNTAIITATPIALKYDFAQWSDGNTDNPRTLTLTQDTALTAQFASVRYDFSAVNEGQKIYYNITSSVAPLTVEVTYATASTYNDYSGAVVIPATVIYRGSTYSVTAIGEYAFRGSTGLTSVTIPNSVKTIGNSAFFQCSGLTEVTIPNSVTSIGYEAFSQCSGLTGILTIPNSVISIGNYAFYDCIGLTGTLIIPNSVTSIGDAAFYGCSDLTSVIIPNSVKTIGMRAFYGCSDLTGTLTIPNSVTWMGEAAFRDCIGLTSVIIGNSVETIGNYAFRNCRNLKTVYFKAITPPVSDYSTFYDVPTNIPVHVPCGRTSAYQNAIEWSLFTNYIDDLPLFNLTVQSEDATKGTASVTESNTCDDNTAIITATPIALKYDFAQWSDGNTDNPRTVTVPKDTILTAQFMPVRYDFAAKNDDGKKIYYNITSAVEPLTVEVTYATESTYNDYSGAVVIPATVIHLGVTYAVTAIGNSAFRSSTGLTSVTIPNSVTSIGNSAFESCRILTSVTIGNAVKTIGNEAFRDCISLTGTLTIPNSVTSMGNSAFYNCKKLDSVTIGNSVKTIGGWAFYYCSELDSVTIGNSVETIGEAAFAECSGLASVTIGNSVKTIGISAFYNCKKLDSVTIYAVTPPSVGTGAFTGVPVATPVHIPCGSTPAYQGTAGWSSFANINGTLPIYRNENAVICQNELPYTWRDTTFQAGSISGEYVLEISGSCDSIVTLNLTVLPEVSTTFTDTICFGATYTANGFNASTTGVHTQDLQAVNGCDSTVTLNLTVLPEVSTTFTDTICFGTAYTANGFENKDTTGVYTLPLTNVNGCDSIVTLNLTVLPEVPLTTFTDTICFGETYTANGFTESVTGVYTQDLQAVNGCDSTVTLTLTVLPEVSTTFTDTICFGETYTANGFNASTTGVYTQDLQAVNGCDSTVTLNLTVLPEVPTTIINATICFGETYTANGFTENATGTYTQPLKAVNGCDSTVTLNLTVLPEVPPTIINATICHGTAYTENGFNENATGVYTQPLKAVNGCDSIVTLNLTVLPEVPTTIINATICFGETYTENGFNASTTGVHTQDLQAVNGCDSIVTLNLTVLPEVSTTFTDTICFGTAYTANGFTESVTGVYTQDLQAVNGCDSIVKLHLTVLPEVPITTFTDTICFGELYAANGFDADTTGVYSRTVPNVDSCDSIVELHLTVLPEVPVTIINATICHGKTYTENGFNASTTGVHTLPLKDVNGCDSIVTLNLTVLPEVPTTIINATICHGATYTENGFNASITGVHTQDLQAVNGCDSIVTLHLTVLPEVPPTIINATICHGETYSANGFNEKDSTDVYTRTFENVNGCDSIVTLHLTVNPLPEVPVYEDIVHGGDYDLPVVENGVWTNEAGEVVTVASASGTYTLTITDPETGCENSTTLTVGITTGINNISAENHFVISPNPARDFVNISGVSGDANVEITDLSGRTVGAWHAVSLQTGEISINVSHLAKGVYLIKVNNAIGKFVKN